MSDHQPVEVETEQPGVRWDPVRLEEYQRRLEAEQSLMLGAIGGFGAALIGAALWAVLTVLTQYQIGWMAVGIGFLVGFSVRWLGKGTTTTFGVMGAVLALFGVVLGNLLSAAIFTARELDVPLANILGSMTPELAWVLLSETFSAMDLVFYAIAVYEAYKFSIRQPTEEELAGLQLPPEQQAHA